jgi:uncharacterized protein YbjQ (UPF0145 family)
VLITTMNDLPGYTNAIIAFRYDTSELGTSCTEVCAAGTACKVAKS